MEPDFAAHQGHGICHQGLWNTTQQSVNALLLNTRACPPHTCNSMHLLTVVLALALARPWLAHAFQMARYSKGSQQPSKTSQRR